MTEAGTTGVRQLKSAEAQKFIVNNRPTLKAAGFNDAQLDMFDKIGADLQRQERFYATKRRSSRTRRRINTRS